METYTNAVLAHIKDGEETFVVTVPNKFRKEFRKWLSDTELGYSSVEESRWFKKYEPDDEIPYRFTRGGDHHAVWE